MGHYMKDRTVMVTGATSELGRVVSLSLARTGARVVMLSRDLPAGEKLRSSIVFETGNRNVEFHHVDLSSQTAIRRFAGYFTRTHGKLTVLVNGAAEAFTERVLTPDGVESTLAINYLSAFLLTNLMLPLLEAGVPSRVINLSSGLHREGSIDLDDLNAQKRFDGHRAYTQSKLAMVLFTYELANRLEPRGITVNCIAPPYVVEDTAKHRSIYSRLLVSLVGRSDEKTGLAADTAIFLSQSPEVDALTGGYFVQREARLSSDESYDPELAHRLWDESAKLTGLNGRGWFSRDSGIMA